MFLFLFAEFLFQEGDCPEEQENQTDIACAL